MKKMVNKSDSQLNKQDRLKKMRLLFDAISPAIRQFPDRIAVLKTFLNLKMQGYFTESIKTKELEMIKVLYKASELKEKEIDGKIK